LTGRRVSSACRAPPQTSQTNVWPISVISLTIESRGTGREAGSSIAKGPVCATESAFGAGVEVEAGDTGEVASGAIVAVHEGGRGGGAGIVAEMPRPSIVGNTGVAIRLITTSRTNGVAELAGIYTGIDVMARNCRTRIDAGPISQRIVIVEKPPPSS
jgi:hypothetical protein